MATLTAQKVRGLISKAGLPLDKSKSRFSSGYAVRLWTADVIEVQYADGSRFPGASWTEDRMTKMADVAQALILAGLDVYMSADARKPYDRSSNLLLSVFVIAAGSAKTYDTRFVPFDGDVYARCFAERIAEEKSQHALMVEKKEREQQAREDAEMRARYLAIQLNPVIKWDVEYPNGVKVTSVRLFDQRPAVLTIATREVEELDWHSNPMRKYTALKVEIAAIYQSRYASQRDVVQWESRRSDVTTKPDETLEDVIWNWIAAHGDS